MMEQRYLGRLLSSRLAVHVGLGIAVWAMITGFQSDSYDEFCSRIGHDTVKLTLTVALVMVLNWFRSRPKYWKGVVVAVVVASCAYFAMPLLFSKQEYPSIDQAELDKAAKEYVEAERQRTGK